VEKASVNLQARIYNVANRRDVEVFVNGKEQSSFSFARSSLTATVSLQEGTNTIRVQVRNADGQDEASVRVTYEKPEPVLPDPVVQIIAPARSGSTVQTDRYNLKARVQHVENKNDVTLLVNGKKLSNFSFDSRRGNLSAFIDLKNGKNDILVQARNESGSASATSSILYEAARQRDKEVSKVQPPTVDITSGSQPTINPLNPTVGSSSIIATITNISSKRQITFTANGKRITDFSFNASSGRFEARVLLEKGENKFILRAENEAGKASDDASVSF